jgi:ppGpp synthetase/RelA/SpoT-type nucleotidyltranferase
LTLSNSQIDRIGQKLRADEVDADCLRKLEEFRSLYAESYKYVENTLVNKMGLSITGRPSKSTVAIIEKLKRESIRLNQIQDVAGCRVLVPDLATQDHLVQNMLVFFSEADLDIDDKRKQPTNGYRAIHVIAKKYGRPVEIQIRTRLQHIWAELSEKVADEFGHSIKYGVGDEDAIRFLQKLATATTQLETTRHLKMALSERKARFGKTKSLVQENKKLNEQERNQLKEIRSIFSGNY